MKRLKKLINKNFNPILFLFLILILINILSLIFNIFIISEYLNTKLLDNYENNIDNEELKFENNEVLKEENSCNLTNKKFILISGTVLLFIGLIFYNNINNNIINNLNKTIEDQIKDIEHLNKLNKIANIRFQNFNEDALATIDEMINQNNEILKK